MTARLWLFDIDGTLVDTGGAGMLSLQEAAQALFGDVGPRLDLAGSTDLGVIAGILAHFGREHADELVDSFFSTYLERLEANLAGGAFPGRVLPGVVSILDSLRERDDVTVGLLTGNMAKGAEAKMRHFGLDHHFPFGAYGDDHHDRNLLGPIALKRAARHTGLQFSPEETLVIGDTPKDIACAKALGARCLAVATGAFSESQLRDFGAHRVVGSLEEIL